jgi:probable rRNA maturation factor
VLAFPIDGPEVLAGWPVEGPAPELGDIVICPDAAQDPLRTLAVHGLLHLLGYDHEIDAGEMLALQDELLQTVVVVGS